MNETSINQVNTAVQDIYHAHPEKDLTAFFAIGMVINIVMLGAFFVWAYKQWGKK